MKSIYFETGDSRRTYSAAGLSFTFTKYGMLGGCPQGVYMAQSAQESAALAALASDPKSGIWEIEQAVYEQRLGLQKSNAPMSWQTFDSTSSKNAAQPPKPVDIIKPTVDRSAFPPPVTAEPEPSVEVKPLAASDEFKVGQTEVVVSPPPAQQSKKGNKNKAQ